MLDLGNYATTKLRGISSGIGYLCETTQLGDAHIAGSVTKLTYSSGISVIAKPRSGIGEAIFYDIAKFILSSLEHACAYPTILVNEKNFSLFSFVQSSSKHDIDKSKYFYSAGVQTAILFCLGASDISYENVIPTKNFPVVIDAETLFSPDHIDIESRKASWPFSISYYSISRVGMLPSNYIFSPIFTERQLSLLKEKDSRLYDELGKFPSVDSDFARHIIRGYFDAIRMLHYQIDHVLKIIHANSQRLSELRLILRPTQEYIAHLTSTTPIENLFSLESNHLKHNVVPYFTYANLSIPFNVADAVTLVNSSITFCMRNNEYIKGAIMRTCR